jgi:tape measure domain-containing protein
MSTEIEQRIVEMQFDNKQFERNVSTTMSSLDKLKQSLNLTGAAKGLESVGAAAKGINLSGLSGAAETVSLKFSGMYSAVDQIFRNLVSRAQYTGERIISAFTIDPIKTGFAEYETQINAVQTILANTKSKGTTIDNVNAALDELNTYADKTIYNFTEMTRNIGTFTAAGVDLDKSVTSIKGIANLAAVSGSTSQQASTAMYQLSQALAAGKVQLMDWNSVVNAGMGGEVFQTALKRTAKNMGTDVDAMIEKYGSFRESLTRGEWLTAEVLTETLTQLSGAYTEADLLAQGYTKQQAKDILELAATAESAATDVKTFTQLMDTLKESAQSGWTQTWEILVGDFEEAKELFSGISKVIGEMIGNSAESRNKLLQGWKDAGGRGELIQGFKNAFEGLMNIVKPISEAFRNIFPPTTVDQLLKFTGGFRDLTGSFAAFTASHGDQIRATFEGIFSVIDIGWTFVKELAGGVVDLLGNLTGLSGGVLDATANLGEWLTNLRDSVKEGDIFGRTIDTISGFIGNIVDKLKGFGSVVKSAFQSPAAITFMDILSGIWDLIVNIGSKVGTILAPLGKAFSDMFANGQFSDILNDGIFAGVLVGIYKFVDNLNGPLGSIKDLFDGLSGEDGIIGGIKETLDSVRGCFEAYQNQLNAEIIKKIATAIAILAAAIFVISSIDGAKLDQSLGAITILFVELIGALSIFSKMDFGLKGLVKGVTAINGLTGALLMLSVAMKIMSTMSWSEIGVGIVGTVAGLGALVAAVNFLPEKNVLKASKAIGKLATALVILAAGMKIMASLSWQELGVAITGVIAGLGALVAAVNLLPKDAGVRTLGMIGLATSLVILGGAMKIMSSMNWDEIGRGLAAMAGSLTAIVLAMNLMPRDMALRSLGMVGLATAMVILGTALKSMGGMTWDEIGRGLTVMGGALVELAIALNLMTGAVAGSAALIIAAGALAIMAPVLQSLGGMSWGEIGRGLVALAGAFTVIGVAGLLLTPLVPTLLAVAGAMALFGAATIGLGAGIALIAYGFTALASSAAIGATAFVAAISAIVVGLIDLIPTIVTHLGDMVVAFCDVIISVAPKLADTLLIVVTEVLASLATYTPQIVNSLLQFLIGVLDALADNLPQLIVSAVNVIGAFFQGVVDALSGLDTTSLLKGIAGVGLLTGLMFALSALLPVIPGAMAGVLGMGVLIAELALVLAAVGALAQIPGLSWLIGEGGDLLQAIGTAIGQFVGGIVGGIAEGATSTLPQVGTNLSSFMTNLQPFITGIQGIDAAVLDNAKTLASTILTLTAADLLSGITSFFSGGSSLADFGTEIASFGTAIKKYSTEVSGLDTGAVSASVSAAKDLVKMAGEIPSDGLFGTDGIDDFGKNVVTFGEKMKKYADKVAGIDAGAITASVSAAKGLVSVAKQIPDDGTFGTDGIDNFGDNIVGFAKSMKKYADKVAGISVDAISKSVSAVRSLISVINSMAGMDSSGVGSFTSALKELGKSSIDKFVQTFSASASKLANVGKDMFDSIILGAKSAEARFVTTIRSMIDAAVKGITATGGKFKAAGIETISKFINGVLSGKSRVSSAFGSALSAALSTINGYRSAFYSAGAYLVSGFANGISANRYKATAQAKAMARAAANAARRELDEHSPSKVGYEIGDFFGIAFVNAIADNTKRAYAVSEGLANSAKTGLKSAFDKVGRIISGEVDVNPTISPVLDLTNVRSGANAINDMFGLRPSVGVLANVGAVSSMMNQRGQNGGNDDVVYAINKLRKDLGNVGGNTYNVNGVTYDNGSEVANAVEALVGWALRERRV